MTSALYVQTRKEVRALLPWSIGVGLATVAMALFAVRQAGFPYFRYDQQVWTLIVYAVGLLTVAGLSMGQEITHRTLPALLMQPVDRRRLLWTKMTVLAVVATALGVIGEMTLPRESLWTGGEPRLLLVWGPAVVAVGLVPLLTLLTRKPLGGVVFAVTVPLMILVVTEWVNPLLDDAHALTIAWYGTLVASVCGVAALVYVFPRVETAGDDVSPGSRSRRLATPAAVPVEVASRTSPVKRHWVWLTVKNELRLQQLTLAVSALFVLLGCVIVVLQRRDPTQGGPGIGALSMLHGIFIAIIAGSRASAEERHIGILATQALQPKAAWKSWAVKVTVTLGLALALAVALPWLFRFVDADSVVVRQGTWSVEIHHAIDWFGLQPGYFAGVVLTTIAALYVSSLNSNSLWALLACFPTGAAIAAIFSSLVVPARFGLIRLYFSGLETLVTPAMRASYRDPGWQIYRDRYRMLLSVEQYSMIILVIGLGLLLLYLANRNHRSFERGAGLVIRQIALIALYFATATALFAVAARIAWWL